MKMSEAFPTKWLSASDLQGRDITLTIQDVQMETVGSPPENLPTVYFQGAGKALVLNKTNGQTIAAQLGDDTDMWRGKQITIYPTSTDFAGKTVPCIRVRPVTSGAGIAASVPGLPTMPSGSGPADPLGDDPLDGDHIPF